MPFLSEDGWISSMAAEHDISELSGCVVAVDASYYLKYLLDHPPAHEPLLPALGGLVGIGHNIDHAISDWESAGITPYFIFDGHPMVGQQETDVQHGLEEHVRLDGAWDLYTSQRAQDAVTAFGSASSFNVRELYPLLMDSLKKRNLHFLVAPYSASAQLAHMDMINSDQCSAIMGSQELLLYPIGDTYISTIDFQEKKVMAVSKLQLLERMIISNELLIEALLLMGTSFLVRCPIVSQQASHRRVSHIIVPEAINLLRGANKSVEQLCNSFTDVLKAESLDWFHRYQKARMALHHFVYIAESGKIEVSNFDELTEDNRLYLGLQLPAEVFYYNSVGLISPNSTNWIPFNKMYVLPTSTGMGMAQDDYKQLVTKDLMPVREQIMAVVLERLNRGLYFVAPYEVRVWFDKEFSHKYKHDAKQSPAGKVNDIIGVDNVMEKYPTLSNGPLAYEIISLLNDDFVKATQTKPGQVRVPLKDAKSIRSLVILRFLYLRGYVGANHKLERIWGTAVVQAIFKVLNEIGAETCEAMNVCEAVFMAFELIRYGHFSAENRYETLQGIPANGSEEDRMSVLLICRCATLLNLRHKTNGYTGPLNKNLLAFNALTTEIRSTNRTLVESLLLALFLNSQAERDRNDFVEINQDLPFRLHPHIGLAVAMKTFLDETNAEVTAAERLESLKTVASQWIPFTTHLVEDVGLVYSLVGAIEQALSSMAEGVSTEVKERWQAANKYLQARPLK